MSIYPLNPPLKPPRINCIASPADFMYTDPVIKVSPLVDTDEALVVTCFPSTGMVSSIVAHYLLEKLDLQFAGGVSDARLPPFCLVQDGAPMPPIRFYAGMPICSLEHVDKLVLIVSEFPVPDRAILPLTRSLLKWSKEAKVKAGVIVDAFPRKGTESEDEDENKVEVMEADDEATMLGVGATEEAREVLRGMEIPPLGQGVLGGMTGVMLGEGRRKGLDMLAILAEADQRMPDARAAAGLIEKLDSLLPAIKLDPEPLYEEAGRLENHLKSMMADQVIPKPSHDSTGHAENSMFV